MRLLTFLTGLASIFAYSTGVDTCVNAPNHGSWATGCSPTNCNSSPFSIQVLDSNGRSVTRYLPNTNYTVTLSNPTAPATCTSSTCFRGFAMTAGAPTAGGGQTFTSVASSPVGLLNPADNTVRSMTGCPNGQTHVSNAYKKIVHTRWVSPDNSSSNVVFKAIIVTTSTTSNYVTSTMLQPALSATSIPITPTSSSMGSFTSTPTVSSSSVPSSTSSTTSSFSTTPSSSTTRSLTTTPSASFSITSSSGQTSSGSSSVTNTSSNTYSPTVTPSPTPSTPFPIGVYVYSSATDCTGPQAHIHIPMNYCIHTAGSTQSNMFYCSDTTVINLLYSDIACNGTVILNNTYSSGACNQVDSLSSEVFMCPTYVAPSSSATQSVTSSSSITSSITRSPSATTSPTAVSSGTSSSTLSPSVSGSSTSTRTQTSSVSWSPTSSYTITESTSVTPTSTSVNSTAPMIIYVTGPSGSSQTSGAVYGLIGGLVAVAAVLAVLLIAIYRKRQMEKKKVKPSRNIIFVNDFKEYIQTSNPLVSRQSSRNILRTRQEFEPMHARSSV